MKNNLFTYATSELSQDAFLCWLFSYAMKDSREDTGLRRCALAFLKEAVTPIQGLPDEEIWVTRISRQHEKIDVLVEVNGQYYIIIEDKTYTSDHDNQLTRYKEILKKEGIPEKETFCLYYKTGTDADFSNAKREGYTVLDRKRILSILKDNRMGIHSDIFCDYCAYLESLEAGAQRYKDAPVSDWDWMAICGYYDDLFRDEDFNLYTSNMDCGYGYVHNASGGFYGAWLYPKEPITHGELKLYPYVQMEFQKGAINICARLFIEQPKEQSLDVLSAGTLRDCIVYNNTEKREYNLEQFGFHKPNRLARGKTMTVGKVWKNDRSDLGHRELTEALRKTIEDFERFISYCRLKIEQK